MASEISELAVEDVDPFEDLLGEVKGSSTPLTDPGSDGAEGVITPISEGCSPDEEHQVLIKETINKIFLLPIFFFSI